MFVDVPLEVHLVAALIVGRGIDVIEGHPDRTRDFEPGLRVEIGVGSPDVDGGPMQSEKRNPVGVIDSSRDGAGYGEVPVTIAFVPAEDASHDHVPDAPGRLGEIAGELFPKGPVNAAPAEVRSVPMGNGT